MKQFNFDTINNFDHHISGSINGYMLLDSLIQNICSFFAKNGETIVDLGCTSGRLISTLATLHPECTCIGYDITDHNFLPSTAARLIRRDITRRRFRIPQANIIMAVFTLQFLKYTDRVAVLNKIFDALNDNGVFILCEKEISRIGLFQEVFTFSNYDYKQHHFTTAEILQKERDLRHTMNCLSTGDNEMLLREAGFTRVETFFRSLNFRGWLCMK